VNEKRNTISHQKSFGTTQAWRQYSTGVCSVGMTLKPSNKCHSLKVLSVHKRQ